MPVGDRAADEIGRSRVRAGAERVRLSLLVALPVVVFASVDPLAWDPFGPLRHGLVLSVALGLVAAFVPTRQLWDRSVETVVFWVSIAWLFVVTAFMGDGVPAWIGTPERHLGAFAWAVFGACFVVGASLTGREGRWLIRAISVGVLLASAYVALETAGLAVDVSFAGDRRGGPFGQPAILGAAVTLGVPVCIGLAIDQDEQHRWRVLGGFAAAGGVSAALAAASRASLVGLVVAAIAVGVVHRASLRSALRPLVAAAGVLAVLAVVTPAASRVGALADGAASSRLDEWQVATRAIADAPFTGYGPEGYRIEFGRHVDDDYVRAYGRSTITDRAHSGPLDVALVGGLPLLVGYLALMGLLARRSVALLGEGGLVAGVGAAVLAYQAHQLFLFPLADIDVVFWLLAGLVVALDRSRGPLRTALVPSGVRRASGTVLLALCSTAAFVGVSDVLADRAVGRSVEAGDFDVAVRQADAAAERAPWSLRYEFVAARTWSLGVGPESVDIALTRIGDAVALAPNDPAVLEERARLLLEKAIRGDHRDDIEAAVVALIELTSSDPSDPTDLVRLGVAQLLAGDGAAATKSWTRAKDLGSADAADLLDSNPSGTGG